jgi:hypothetical protein
MARPNFQLYGVLGIATFWCHVFLICISLASTAFSIYWMTLTSSFWLSVLNSSILIANCFLLIFSLTSSVFLILYAAGVEIRSPSVSRIIFTLSAFASQISLCALLSLTTESEANLRYQDLNDYCVRFFAEEAVKSFLAQHSTELSVWAYISRRTRDLYPSTAAFLGLWFPATVFFSFAIHVLDPPGGVPPAPHPPRH